MHGKRIYLPEVGIALRPTTIRGTRSEENCAASIHAGFALDPYETPIILLDNEVVAMVSTPIRAAR